MTSGGVQRLVEAVNEARATFGKDARAICEGVATLVARMTERANIMWVCAYVQRWLWFVLVGGSLKVQRSFEKVVVEEGRRSFGKEVYQSLFYVHDFTIHVRFTFACPTKSFDLGCKISARKY
jgi:hypothetical protein